MSALFISGVLIGLVGSLHCVGMCGPIVMALNYRQKNLIKNITYHSGRLLSYVMLGLIFGLIGAGISLGGFQQGLSVLAGVIIIGITLLPGLKANYMQTRWQQMIVLPMKRRLLKAVNKGTYTTLFSLGFLNGLLPCGVVYLAIAASLATGDMLNGAIMMSGFGLATWPLMLVMAMGGQWILNRFHTKLHYTIPFVAVFMGTLLILRGLALDIPYVSPVLTEVFGNVITICR